MIVTPSTRVLAACLLVLAGCRTAVRGPSDVEHPTPVYLAHYDRYHTSLVIPGAGHATEYTYGDLDLFAHYDQSFWPAFKGMTFPTQGVLGRRTVSWDGEDLEALRVALDNRESCNRVSRIQVDAALLAPLESELETSFEAARSTVIDNETLGIAFVQYPRSYTFVHNCNHQLAAWLERLGCHVSWARALAKFEVLEPPDSSATGP